MIEAPHTFSLAMDRAGAGSPPCNAAPQQPSGAHNKRQNPSVLCQSRPAMLNVARSKPSLRQQRSKLHLIDDTTLTSLPLPPPPPTKWRRRQLELPENKPANVDVDFGNEARFQSFSELSALHANDVDCDDSFADSQDPIVLVEDYMTGAAESHSEETLLRKQSVANFKKRARDDMLRCSSDSTIDLRPLFPPNEPQRSAGPREDLEAMFGTIPGSDKLKHCTLCDKPLYEISSLMNSAIGHSRVHEFYNELVCSGCINTYQQVLDEMYQAEANRAAMRPSMSRTFDSLTNVYQRDAAFLQTLNTNSQKKIKRQFSRNLIGRLQNLSELSLPKPSGSDWLKLLQDKLKWRS